MDLEKTIYEVEVAGVPLKLRSSHDLEMVQGLVNLVNLRVDEVLGNGNSGRIPHQSAILLASLHIAEELTLLKKASLVEINKIEGRTKKLIAEIDASPISQVRMDI